MADNDISAQLEQARKMIRWIYLLLAACVMILLIDLMLKRQLGHIAVEVARAGSASAAGMAVPPDHPDRGGRDGSDDLDGTPPVPADDADAGGPGKKLPRSTRGGQGGRPVGDGQ
jgi:hypothetical protein